MAAMDRVDPVILGHVLAEHRELFNLMVGLRSAFAAKEPPSRGRVDETLAMLARLGDHLRSHFAQEERGGFLEDSVARMPRLAATVDSILRQHPALLAELDGLSERLRAAGPTATDWERARRDFEAFAADMSAHEQQENAALQEGYNEDLGLVD
ncbi:MAG: hypothetical protein EBZ59_06555 [Planctomycetia bacterium]|nr:hypothetical protein [Planctomycetia bacterium]